MLFKVNYWFYFISIKSCVQNYSTAQLYIWKQIKTKQKKIVKFSVVAIMSDMRPKNKDPTKILDITTTNPYFEYPNIPKGKAFCFMYVAQYKSTINELCQIIKKCIHCFSTTYDLQHIKDL